MFALPLTPSLPSTLASHVFGRFASASTQRSAVAMAAVGSAVPARLAAAAPVVEEFEEEEEFDLAQRVREVGEW